MSALLLALATGLASCTRPAIQKSKIKLVLPQASGQSSSAQSLSQSVSALSGSKWGLVDPSVRSEINCYFVAVEIPEQGAPNRCMNISAVELLKPSIIVGGYLPGSTIELEVPSGNARKISLIGFKAASPTECVKVSPGLKLNAAQFSNPVVLASAIADLSSGDNVVDLTIPATLAGLSRFEECVPMALGTSGVQPLPSMTISAIVPISGPVAGGNLVTISGTGFITGAQPRIGGSPCSIFTYSPTSIQCYAPSHAIGTYNVSVTLGAQTVTLPSAFTYTAQPSISILDASYGESVASVDLTLVISPPATAPINFTYLTFASGSAAQTADFNGASGSATIPPGAATYTLTLNGLFVPDTMDEFNEDFYLDINYSGPDATVVDGSALITIVDDDAPPIVSFSASSNSILEGGTDTVLVNLSAVSGKPISVGFSETGSASSPSDYAPVTPNPILISAGTLSVPVTIATVSDGVAESPESVTLSLLPGSNYAVSGNPPYTLTINDNTEPVASISGAPPPVTSISSLLITVFGTGVADYQHALQLGGSCAGATYGGFVAVGTPITNNLFVDGQYTLCVKGRSSGGVVQSTATSFSFTRDTLAPTFTIAASVPIAPASVVSDYIEISVQSSEPVTGLDASDFQENNGLLANFQQIDSQNYKMILLPDTINNGTFVRLLGGRAQDAALNVNATTQINFNITGIPEGKWSGLSITGSPPLGKADVASAWLGSRFLVFGGSTLSGETNSNSMFYPGGVNNWIVPTMTGVPGQRSKAASVWTGLQFVVWGGQDGGAPLSTGGSYHVGTNTWTATATTGSPAARYDHSAVWNGNRMVIAGGQDGSSVYSQVYSFDPFTNSWTSTGNNLLIARHSHSAHHLGAKMFVYGGVDGSGNVLSSGELFDYMSGAVAVSTSNQPSPRRDFVSLVVDGRVIVWGGGNGSGGYFNDGAIYDPASNSWVSTSMVGAPSPRSGSAAVWTGTHMLIYGGEDASNAFNDAYAFDPSSNTWSKLATPFLALSGTPRLNATAVWTGSQMIVYGGTNKTGTGFYNGGAILDPGNLGGKIKTIVAGEDHSCAISASGSVKCWGSNSFGKLGLGDSNNRGAVPGQMSAALQTVNLGSDGSGNPRKAIQLALGKDHTCALLDNFKVKCWGSFLNGRLGFTGVQNIGDDAGEMGDSLTEFNIGPSFGRAVKIAAGQDHTCAIAEDARAFCWGNGLLGRIGDGLTVDRGTPSAVSGSGFYSDIALGAAHTCGKSINRIDCWGSNLNYQGATGSVTPSLTPAGPAGSSNDIAVDRIVSKGDHTCIESLGFIKCWGKNTGGQLGVGNTSTFTSSLPTVSGGPSWQPGSLSVGIDHSCAVAFGVMKCWGQGSSGALGLDSTVQQTAPAAVLSIANGVSKIASGLFFNCALYQSNQVKCWGANSSGQLGVGSIVSKGYLGGDMSSLIFTDIGFLP